MGGFGDKKNNNTFVENIRILTTLKGDPEVFTIQISNINICSTYICSVEILQCLN